MKKHNVPQQSSEWFALRAEYPLTGSNGLAIATGGKGLETLCWTAIAERMSTGDVERYSGKDTDRGNELEPQARVLYELETGRSVEEVGFITNDTVSSAGGVSVDGLVGDDGNLEIKCPADVKYIKLLAQYKDTGSFEVENGYMAQMQMQMLFAEREWTDYMVFNPNFTPSYIIQRVVVDAEMVEKLKCGLQKGEELLKEITNKLK